MEASHDQATQTAADKAFHLSILDATHNPVLQGFRGAIDTILSAVFVVAVDSVDGWFEDNLANHAATARAIDDGDAEKRAACHGAGPSFQPVRAVSPQCRRRPPEGHAWWFRSLRKK